MEKHQCIARLDKLEIEKLDEIRASEGLSRSGMIRRLIRDFNIESEGTNSGNKFIVSEQISKNIFLQLPYREADITAGLIDEGEGVGDVVVLINDVVDERVKVVGFVKYPAAIKPSNRDSYQHDILYCFESKLYRTTAFSGEGDRPSYRDSACYTKQIAEFRETENYLQQIFVV